jgi:hypothetical protein
MYTHMMDDLMINHLMINDLIATELVLQLPFFFLLDLIRQWWLLSTPPERAGYP